jgi:alkanesulfonate monooxygenase SsuD/methylene tetrahydromethanopterin reductase-like flavin-dependent oxidoreductase (luciferase family)
LAFGSLDDRLAELAATVCASRDRGFPVWIGGLHREVRALAAAEADGWNRWGGPVDRFAEQARAVRAAAVRDPFVCSWGGLVVLGATDAVALEKAERLGARSGTIVGGIDTVTAALAGYAAAGAGWVIAGPVDSRDPENAATLAAVRARLVDRAA